MTYIVEKSAEVLTLSEGRRDTCSRVSTKVSFFEEIEDGDFGIRVDVEQKFGNQTVSVYGLMSLQKSQIREIVNFLQKFSASEIEELLDAGRIIEAIKKHSAMTGCGLKESKDYIDKLRASRGLI